MNGKAARSTDDLIRKLGAQLQPVKPLRPPVARALLWLLGVAVVSTPLVLRMSDLPLFVARGSDARFALELAGTLATGIVAVVAAFYLSIPGRSERWRYAPLPPLLLWLGCSGLGCLRNGLGEIDAGCLVFLVVVSLPLSVVLFMLLRLARPIAPLPVALMASLGVAGLSAFLLQFFHPFDVTVLDLAVHAAGIGLIMGAAATIGRRALGNQSAL
jgi:hypothetical protein